MKRSSFEMAGVVIIRFDKPACALRAWLSAHGHPVHRVAGPELSSARVQTYLNFPTVALRGFELAFLQHVTGINKEMLETPRIHDKVWTVLLKEHRCSEATKGGIQQFGIALTLCSKVERGFWSTVWRGSKVGISRVIQEDKT